MAAAKKKSTVKKAAVKKAPAKKAPVKKAAAKKAVAKKTVAKKPVAKKSVAKKAPVKKVATKKAAVKKAPAKKVVTKRAAVKVSALPEIPEVRFSSTVARPRSVVIEAPLPPVTTQPEIVQEKKSKKRGFIYILIIALFAAAGFAFNLSADVEIESSESIVVETPAPTATSIESASPTSEPSQIPSTSKANAAAALFATPDFIYTSTGIRFIWKTSGFENFTSVSLSASEGGSDFVVLTTADGSATFIDIAKVDTVSKTTFFLTFTTESSRSVVSEKITIRGKFTK